MRSTLKKKGMLLFFACLVLMVWIQAGDIVSGDKAGQRGTKTAKAAEVNVTVHNGESLTQDVHIGDTGHIQLSYDGVTDAQGNPINPEEFTISYGDEDDYWGDEAVRVDENGYYTALGKGEFTVYIKAGKIISQGYSPELDNYSYYEYDYDKDIYYEKYFQAQVTFSVSYDMTNVNIMKNRQTLYMSGNRYTVYKKKGHYEKWFSSGSVVVPFEGLTEETVDDMYISCKYTKKSKIYLSADLQADGVHFYADFSSKNPKETTTVTMTIENKTFTINLTLTTLRINKRSLVASHGKKLVLKVQGINIKPEWSSTNEKVVTVNSAGKITCKKRGNGVVTAKITTEDGTVYYFGCAVSVVSKRMVKVVKYATYIGTHWKYSQPKRMSSGYYDCSSLVWKAYRKAGTYIGNAKSYAPVAADIAKWSKSHGKVISKSYTSKQLDKMIFNPGDLAFGTGAKNGRYMGIYHVEMFTGYAVSYYDSKGKPHLNELWAARSEGYYGGGKPIYRPYKNF